jgi:hypothetical protein
MQSEEHTLVEEKLITAKENTEVPHDEITTEKPCITDEYEIVYQRLLM